MKVRIFLKYVDALPDGSKQGERYGSLDIESNELVNALTSDDSYTARYVVGAEVLTDD